MPGLGSQLHMSSDNDTFAALGRGMWNVGIMVGPTSPVVGRDKCVPLFEMCKIVSGG